jgi:hypothetical protein
MAEDGNDGTTVVVKPTETIQVAKTHSNGPDSWIAIAIENNYDLDKLMQLIAMKEKMDAKKAKAEFDAALAKFQEEVPAIIKNKDGWDKKYRYADLGKIDSVIKHTKAKNGFSHKFKYAQVPGPTPHENEIWIQVTCVLSHVGGHSEETILIGPPDNSVNKDGKATKNPIQSNGSTVTYLERYTLKGALGLSTTQDDTDGINPESKGGNGPKQDRKIQPSEKQWNVIKKTIQDGKKKKEDYPNVDFTPTENGYKAILAKVASGETTVETAQKFYDFNEEQLNDLKSQVPKK